MEDKYDNVEEFFKYKNKYEKIINEEDVTKYAGLYTNRFKADIKDHPMTCCGMLEGSGFDRVVPTEVYVGNHFGHLYVHFTYRNPTKEEIHCRFMDLLNSPIGTIRNCTIISLSSQQQTAISIAEELGFQKVHTFFNPNSGNDVYIYVHMKWADKYAYNEWKRKN